MQYTPELLHKHAQVLVEQEVKQNRNIQAAYLRGSLLYGSPLLGGVGDIDLVFIHASSPLASREIRMLTPEIFFDIEHHDLLLYKTPRKLRLDPWFGPSLRDAVPLHDPRHLLDYTQSGVRSNFDFPENIQARSHKLLNQARQFWLDRQTTPPQEILLELPAFLSALENALNAVALLSGPPLAIRRLGLEFAHRAEQVNAPGLVVAVEHLLGAIKIPPDQLMEWLSEWSQAMEILQAQTEQNAILAELEIYLFSAMEGFIQNNSSLAGLWPLLNTWTELITLMPDNSQLQRPWIGALTSLGFAGSDYQIRLAAFDGFLELCEALVEKETHSAS